MRYHKIEIHLLNLELLRKGKKIFLISTKRLLSMYARGLTTRQISDQIEELYGLTVQKDLFLTFTIKILQEIEDWQNKAFRWCILNSFYWCCSFSVREDNRIKELAAYIIFSHHQEGKKDVSLEVGENEVVSTGWQY